MHIHNIKTFIQYCPNSCTAISKCLADLRELTVTVWTPTSPVICNHQCSNTYSPLQGSDAHKIRQLEQEHNEMTHVYYSLLRVIAPRLDKQDKTSQHHHLSTAKSSCGTTTHRPILLACFLKYDRSISNWNVHYQPRWNPCIACAKCHPWKNLLVPGCAWAAPIC